MIFCKIISLIKIFIDSPRFFIPVIGLKLRILLLLTSIIIISIIFAGCVAKNGSRLPDNTIKIVKLNMTEFSKGIEFTVKNNLCNYSAYEIIVESNRPGEIFVKFCEKSKSNWSCTYLKKYLGLPIPGNGRSPMYIKLYRDLKRNESLTVNISGEFETFDPKNVEITIMVKQEYCIQKLPPLSPPPTLHRVTLRGTCDYRFQEMEKVRCTSNYTQNYPLSISLN